MKKQKTVIRAETQEIDANAKLIVLEKEVVGRKKLAEVSQDEIAAQGIGEAKAMNAKTEAAEKSGAVEAKNIEIIGKLTPEEKEEFKSTGSAYKQTQDKIKQIREDYPKNHRYKNLIDKIKARVEILTFD